MSKHVRSFPIISDVLSRLVTKGQTPSLRRKAGELTENRHSHRTSQNIVQSQQPVQNRLWRLLHAKLKRGVGTEKCPKTPSSSQPMALEDNETDPDPLCLTETADDAHFQQIDSDTPQPDPEFSLTSGWPPPLVDVDEYHEDMYANCLFDVSLCHNEIDVEPPEPHANSQYTEVDMQWSDVELDGRGVPYPLNDEWTTDDTEWGDVEFNDEEDTLGGGCDYLSPYYSDDQFTQQQSTTEFDQDTPDTAYPDEVGVGDYLEIRKSIEWHGMETAVDVDTTSREDDYGFRPSCGPDDDMDMDPDNAMRRYYV